MTKLIVVIYFTFLAYCIVQLVRNMFVIIACNKKIKEAQKEIDKIRAEHIRSLRP